MASKTTIIVFFTLCVLTIYAQNVKYSPAWFGPNANPVPEFTDATIVEKTKIQLMSDYYFGYGDQTVNGYFKIDVPLLPKKVSIKLWTSILEHYWVEPQLGIERDMTDELKGSANGDIYVQTRISITNETKYIPTIILNSTLKTASGTQFKNRRYFDTPGYYFDVEMGKSFMLNNQFLKEIRLITDIGFFSWETSGSRQNDAPMYGFKLQLGNQKWKWENSISGYHGWMHTNPYRGSDYGDSPLVYVNKINLKTNKFDYFAQYQYGIKDFPYHQIRIGTSFTIDKLTPKYR